MDTMTPEERAATEAFHADLLEQFKANATAMWKAREAGEETQYAETFEETRRLYREIREVEVVLATGILPRDIQEATAA